MTDADIEDARQKMIQARFGGAAPTKGKNSARRKKKVKSRSQAAQSDAKLSSVVNKLGATHIPGIEEVNLFQEDGTVIHFKNPKVQAAISANTYIISGPNQQKQLQELLPGLVGQLGGGGMDDINLAMAQQQAAAAAGMGGAGMMPSVNEDDDDDDDDDVPDLVEGTFEEVSEK